VKTKTLITVLLVLTSSFQVYSQSIFSILARTRDRLELKKEYKVKEVTKKTTFFTGNGITIEKSIFTLNELHKPTLEVRYNQDGKLKTRLSTVFDSAGVRSLKRKIEHWHPVIGYRSEMAVYEYDQSGFLIKIIDYNGSGVLERETLIKNNDKGSPIELKLYTKNATFYGTELAKYNYENNSVKVKCLNSWGNLTSEKEHKIDFSVKDYSKNTYDENGNIVKSENYQYKYKYDKKLNWVKKWVYRVVDGKRKKYQVITREIEYIE